MTVRTFRRVTFLFTSLLTAACGADRATAPDPDAKLAAAVAAGTPTSFGAWPASDVQIDMSWQDNSPNETGFEVHRSTTGISGAYTLLKTVSANVTTASDPGRTPLTEYCYKVRNVRAHGKATYSDFSTPACATTYGKPAAPTTVTTTRQPWYGFISVSWSASPTATGYRVQRSPTAADPWELAVSTSDVSYNDPLRAGEEQTCYRVIAYNAWGESAPSAIRCSALPATPSELDASVVSTGGVDIVWKDNSSIEDAYEVQRSGADFVFTVIATVAANVHQFHDAVTAQGRYWYRVRAKKGTDYSGFSNSDDALIINGPPSAPTGVWTVPTSSSSVSVYWQYASGDVETFQVERSTDGRVTWALAGTSGWNQYTTQYGFGDGDRTAEREVCYRVKAHNSGGDSPASDVACATPMAAPSGLTATALGSSTIRLTWTPHSTAHDGYEILRMYCYEGGYYYGGWYCYYTTIATVGPSETSYDDMGLNPSEYNSYYVVAYKDGNYRGYSDWSNEAGTTTASAP